MESEESVELVGAVEFGLGERESSEAVESCSELGWRAGEFGGWSAGRDTEGRRTRTQRVTTRVAR